MTKRSKISPTALRDVIEIMAEESFAQEVAIGAMDRETAKFLASHPSELRAWKEDKMVLERFDY